MYVAFKMKCNAAQYYASNPAVGVISPKGSSMISGKHALYVLNRTIILMLIFNYCPVIMLFIVYFATTESLSVYDNGYKWSGVYVEMSATLF